jgi:hypothetical protein
MNTDQIITTFSWTVFLSWTTFVLGIITYLLMLACIGYRKNIKELKSKNEKLEQNVIDLRTNLITDKLKKTDIEKKYKFFCENTPKYKINDQISEYKIKSIYVELQENDFIYWGKYVIRALFDLKQRRQRNSRFVYTVVSYKKAANSKYALLKTVEEEFLDNLKNSNQ